VKALLALTVAAPLLIVGSAKADDIPNYFNSGKLLKSCTSNNGTDHALCLGYIAAASDYIDMMNAIQSDDGKKICAPSRYNLGQLRAVIVGYLTASPNDASSPGTFGVTMALAKAFPCKES
jgi:hypothetical protein